MAAKRDQVRLFLQNLEAQSAEVYKAFIAAADALTSTVALGRFADAFARGDIEEVLRILGMSDAAFGPIDEAVRETFKLGAASATIGLRPNSFGARILGRFSVRNPGAEAWLAENAAARVTGYMQNMRDVLQDTLLQGMQQGANPLKTARELVGTLQKTDKYRKGGTLLLTRQRAATVRNAQTAFRVGDVEGMRHYLTLGERDRRFDGAVKAAIAKEAPLATAKADQIIGYLADNYLKERAELIARTEALAALNAGKAEAFRQATSAAGINDSFIHREWSSTGDKKVRPDHQHLDGQKVVGINTPYRLPDGQPIMRPGDMKAGVKQVARCRCMEYLEVDWFEGRA